MERNPVGNGFRLDPKEHPKQVELELPDAVIAGLAAIAQKTGRSFSEVATDILSKAVDD